MHQQVVDLNNEGALVTYVEESPLSIEELEEKQFENDFIYDNFIQDEEDDDDSLDEDYLLKVRMQNLYQGGMMISLGFHYQICDVNSMYVFTADLCSLIRRNIFAFKESQVR